MHRFINTLITLAIAFAIFSVLPPFIQGIAIVTGIVALVIYIQARVIGFLVQLLAWAAVIILILAVLLAL